MATQFLKNITNSKATLANRAALIEKQAIAAQTGIITSLELNKMKTESQLQSLLDFAPDSSYSLKPGRPDFNASAWAKEVHKLNCELIKIEEQLTIANKTYTELFTNEDSAE